MKIFAIYVTIGIIEYLLVAVQVKALMIKEERENSVHFTPTSKSNLEKGLALMKSVIPFMIPVLRTIVTLTTLFSEQTQAIIIKTVRAKNKNYNEENA